MWIRYIARTDDTPIGHTAALYCDALVATGMPVRLVSAHVAELQVDARGRCASAWDRHRGLLLTPMDGPFVNVVCGEVSDWVRYYTEGVTNALLFSATNLGNGEWDTVESLTTIAKYEYVYVPDFIAASVARLAFITPIPIDTMSAAAAFRNLQVF